ncbi:MAG: PKD domain-containing protein [Isosphaeraceae bacterium]
MGFAREKARRVSLPSAGWIRPATSLLALILAVELSDRPVQAGVEPPAPPEAYQRRVQIPAGLRTPRVIVTEFFTQGAIDAHGENVHVEDLRGQAVPWRVLQVGPGDTCRLAFQPTGAGREFRIRYGGPAVPSTPWIDAPGLVFEARRWKDCDLNQLDAIRNAFHTAPPIGADYIPSLFHRYNPVSSEAAPFLSRTAGVLEIQHRGSYRFVTSSQDASFLLIDDRVVVAAPGHHGPTGTTRFRTSIELEPGSHAFEYIHAASGPECCLVAAWQPPGTDRVEPIPPSAFGAERIARLPAVELQHGGRRLPREFAVESLGEVSLDEKEPPLVRVRFRVTGASSTASRPRLRWSFGDGQTSSASDPTHVYLHPGLYTVRIAAIGESDGLAVVNRVLIQSPQVLSDTTEPADTLSSYLPLIETYDASTLDPLGLLQLVRVEMQTNRLSRAAKLGETGLAGRTSLTAPEGLLAARAIGTILRDALDRPDEAESFWSRLATVFAPDAWRAECLVVAADIALNDRLDATRAQKLLDQAEGLGRRSLSSEIASRLARVRADWHARQGDRKAAEATYLLATKIRDDRRPVAEQEAWRGALSRSSEAYLREKELDRARDELRRWESEFPGDRGLGDLSLLMARERASRGKFAQAIAIATDLVATRPDSPQADRILYLAAECEEKRGQPQRALDRFLGLVRDYPGSPLVSESRAHIARLDSTRKSK